MRPWSYGFGSGKPEMPPFMKWHTHWHHYRWARRGPSRLLWFAIGAGTAAWWMHHRDQHREFLADDWRARWRPDGSREWGLGQGWHGGWKGSYGVDQDGMRANASMGPSGEGSMKASSGRSAGRREEFLGDATTHGDARYHAMTPPPATDTSMAPSNETPYKPPFEHDWDAEREKVRDIARQLSKTMSELSEANLDAMLAGLQGLKQRLANHRMNQESSQHPIAAGPQQPQQERPTQPPSHWV